LVAVIVEDVPLDRVTATACGVLLVRVPVVCVPALDLLVACPEPWPLPWLERPPLLWPLE